MTNAKNPMRDRPADTDESPATLAVHRAAFGTGTAMTAETLGHARNAGLGLVFGLGHPGF